MVVRPALAVFGIPFEIYSAQLDALSFVDDTLMKILLTLMLLALESSAFVLVSARLLDWASSLPIGLDNQLVNSGWTFVSGFTNLLFILILVAIALAYILKLETWGMKKALPRLIIIILLINFSLLFVKIFADIGWIVQNSFRGVFFGEGGTLFSAIADLLAKNLKGIALPFLEQIGAYLLLGLIPFAPIFKLLWWGTAIINQMLSGVFTNIIVLIVFNFVTGFVFFVYAILFLLRIVIIWLLAIAAPLAFAAYILTPTQKYFSQWFRHLLQWSFLGVVMLFLIGLGVKLFWGAAPATGFSEVLGKKDFFREYTQLAFFLIYLIATLFVTKKFVPAGVNMVWGAGAAMLTGGAAMTAAQTQKWGRRADIRKEEMKAKEGRRIEEKAQRGELLTGREKMTRWTIRRTGGVELAEARATEGRRRLVFEERQKLSAKTKDMDEEGVKAHLQAEFEKHKRAPLRDKRKTAALMELLAEKDALKEDHKDLFEEASRAGGASTRKKALERKLHWGTEEEIKNRVATMNPGDIDKLSILNVKTGEIFKETEKVIGEIVNTYREDFINRLGSQSKAVRDKVQAEINKKLGGKDWETQLGTFSDEDKGKALRLLRGFHTSPAAINLGWEQHGTIDEIDKRIAALRGKGAPPPPPRPTPPPSVPPHWVPGPGGTWVPPPSPPPRGAPGVVKPSKPPRGRPGVGGTP